MPGRQVVAERLPKCPFLLSGWESSVPPVAVAAVAGDAVRPRLRRLLIGAVVTSLVVYARMRDWFFVATTVMVFGVLLLAWMLKSRS